jgi:hypothetical protein
VIPAATIGWTALIVTTGDVGSNLRFVPGAALFAFVNVTVGVVVFQAVRLSLHRVFNYRLAARS